MPYNRPMSAEQIVRDWLRELQACVRAVDYDRAEQIFAPDVVGFGTYKSVAQGIKTLRAEQWSNIWPNIRNFTFRVDELKWGAEGDLAWAVCTWDSIGFRDDGSAFDRPGRMTIILERRQGKWLAVHTHFSLFPTH